MPDVEYTSAVTQTNPDRHRDRQTGRQTNRQTYGHTAVNVQT